MDVVVTCEFRFFRTPDKKVWTSSAFVYQFWLRYMVSFQHVIVVARIQDVTEIAEGWQESSGDKVEFVALPYYVGFTGLLKNLIKIRNIINRVATVNRALIYRVPSQSAMLASIGKGRANGYALEVVGDPYDVFSSGITNGLLDKVLGWLSYLGLKYMANHALASCYVTNKYLQNRYPVNKAALSVGCSDIELTAKNFKPAARSFSSIGTHLVFVGSFAQLYKGPDLLIKAIALLKEQGFICQATLLGGGQYLEDMKKLAIQHNCQELIRFVGEVNQIEVMQHLDDAQLFVMPSRTEGLPRALIEAMARGLPCIASSVGGIPELLDEQYLIENGNWQQLAKKIKWLLSSPVGLSTASQQNLERAHDYENEKLRNRRQSFYQAYAKLKDEFE